jgi:hypothetical protein
VQKWMKDLSTLAFRNIKVAIFVALAAGPWAFAVRGLDGLSLLGFRIFVGCGHTTFIGWASGVIFGIATVIYLGLILGLIAPVVSSTTTFLMVAAGSGLGFSVLWAIAAEIAAPVRGR